MPSLIRAAVNGSLNAAMVQEVRDVSAGLRRAVERTGRAAQAELRAQARATGFRDGGRALANAWRLRVYPPNPSSLTFRPAALVWSNSPDIAEAFDRGVAIVAKRTRYLAFPTGYNAIGGRRNAGRRGGLRITPQQMLRARGQAFVIRSKTNPSVLLWCLRVSEARGLSRRSRNRVRLFVGSGTEVLTGNRRGQQARAREVLAQGFVPMFFLMRRVTPRKRLDIEGVRRLGAAALAAAVATELRR